MALSMQMYVKLYKVLLFSCFSVCSYVQDQSKVLTYPLIQRFLLDCYSFTFFKKIFLAAICAVCIENSWYILLNMLETHDSSYLLSHCYLFSMQNPGSFVFGLLHDILLSLCFVKAMFRHLKCFCTYSITQNS